MSTPVLVTGGAGFIGSHVVEALLELGYAVRVLDNFSTGKMGNLEGLGDGRWNPGRDFELIEADIRDLDAVLKATQGVGAVLHQAALGSVPLSIEDPVNTQQVNADGTLNVFEAARRNGVSRVVYASSSSVYGDGAVLPKKEGTEGRSLSPYALTKQVNEEFGRLYRELYGLETIGLRYFNVYGPRQDSKSAYAAVIPAFVSALLKNERPIIHGSGEQTRDFTFVRDAASANMRAMKSPSDSAGSAYNVGSGSRTSVLELLRALQDLLGSNIEPQHEPPRRGDVMHSWADMSLTFEKIGFRSEYDLEEGLKQSIGWYKADRG
jgi:UDP-N-acetylglucosamine 4-epimerase